MTKTYYWKNLECELCKTPFPHIFKTDKGKELKVVDYQIPVQQENVPLTYMVLESISSNTSKVIHVVNLSAINEIRLGRGHDCDVRITDISVSRLHSYIRKHPNGFFYLEDNNSKFGTLALIKTPIQLPSNKTTYIQAGRTMLYIDIKRNYKFCESVLCFGASQ